MALTPCQRYRARILAQQALDKKEALTSSPTSLHLQIGALTRDVERLRSQEVIADRIEMKRDELLPKWLPTVEAYLESGAVHEHPVFAYCVVWLFDVGEMDKALDWADIAIEQGQKTPENFSSSFAAFVADTVLAWAQQQADNGHSVEPYFSRTFESVTEKWRIHEEIKAKWFKFAGLQLLSVDGAKPAASALSDVATLQQADNLLAKAASFNPAIGVKSIRDKISSRIRALQKE
ncbi:phage terminase small subunit [Edaphovirga cremea]|uniref:phage terminase small subunit n=1 Tax=Edaphovirga cremea TaxID=2267246 RepID=UPI00398A0CA4